MKFRSISIDKYDNLHPSEKWNERWNEMICTNIMFEKLISNILNRPTTTTTNIKEISSHEFENCKYKYKA